MLSSRARTLLLLTPKSATLSHFPLHYISALKVKLDHSTLLSRHQHDSDSSLHKMGTWHPINSKFADKSEELRYSVTVVWVSEYNIFEKCHRKSQRVLVALLAMAKLKRSAPLASATSLGDWERSALPSRHDLVWSLDVFVSAIAGGERSGIE